MGGGVYRLAAIMLVICMGATAVAISIGYLSTSTLAIDYHENESEVYVMAVRDMAHDFRWQVAGTRCFKPLPPWVYNTRERGEVILDFGRTFRRRATGDELVALLHCW